MTDSHAFPEPVPQLVGKSSYRPPPPPYPIDLNLAGNEGAVPSGELLDALVSRGVEVLRRYPSSAELTATLAAKIGVDADRVLVTAGADESIDRVCRSFLAVDRELLLPVPTFEMFDHYAALTGCRVVEVPWLDDVLPVEAMLARVNDRTAVVTVVSPNNPTGAVASADDLVRLSKAAPQAVLLVDLAYAEFADEDLTAAALELPNAVVCRSLSKAWGLAGLRVGYALGRPELLATLAGAGGPFSVAGPSLALACAALERDVAELTTYVAEVRDNRETLAAALRQRGVTVASGQGNFVLARLPDAIRVRDAFAKTGIGVRVWPGRKHLENAVRISVPTGADFARLMSTLTSAIESRS